MHLRKIRQECLIFIRLSAVEIMRIAMIFDKKASPTSAKRLSVAAIAVKWKLADGSGMQSENERPIFIYSCHYGKSLIITLHKHPMNRLVIV